MTQREWKVGDRFREGDEPGNILVLVENEENRSYLDYLVKSEFGWAWTRGPEPEDWGRSFEDAFRHRNSPYMIVYSVVPKPEPEPEPQTVRARVLDEAKRITATDRNSAYGEPEDNFQRIADYWNVWLQDRLKEGAKITPGDTAAMMIMVKLAREMNAPKEDNKTDGAGYFACWAEVDANKK